MSRHPVKTRASSRRTVAEEYISFIAKTSTPKAMTWDDIREASSKDDTIMKTLQFVQNIAVCTKQAMVWNQNNCKPLTSARAQRNSSGQRWANCPWRCTSPQNSHSTADSIVRSGYCYRTRRWPRDQQNQVANTVKAVVPAYTVRSSNPREISPGNSQWKSKREIAGQREAWLSNMHRHVEDSSSHSPLCTGNFHGSGNACDEQRCQQIASQR